MYMSHRRKNRQFLRLLGLVVGGLLGSIVFAQGVGGGGYSWHDSFALFSPSTLSTIDRTILFHIRLPRIIIAVLVGGGLALGGAALQGMFHNPLVDPYVLGVSSGAALGAVVAMVSGIYFGLFTIPLFAFSGAVCTAFVVFRLGMVAKRIPLETLLLAGVAMGMFLSAFISLGMFLAGEDLHQIVFWTMGGLWGRGWMEVRMVVFPFLIGVPLLFSFTRELNAFLLGEKVAQSLGVDVEKVKKWLLLFVSLLVASCVAVSGVIGFVGLVVPHLLRLLGCEDHRFLLPLSFLVGGVVLLWADTLARTILNPVELPVGIVTSIIGAPFFIYLLRRKKREW